MGLKNMLTVSKKLMGDGGGVGREARKGHRLVLPAVRLSGLGLKPLWGSPAVGARLDPASCASQGATLTANGQQWPRACGIMHACG